MEKAKHLEIGQISTAKPIIYVKIVSMKMRSNYTNRSSKEDFLFRGICIGM
jgi:hypothetical protein